MTFDEFAGLARKHNVIPVNKAILADTFTPVSAYLHLREGAASSFLLESVEGGERFARYSFIGRDPVALIRCKGNTTTVTRSGTTTAKTENFFALIQDMVGSFSQPVMESLPR